MRAIGSFAVFMGMCWTADAQLEKGTFAFDVVGGPVSECNPVVSVRLWASFPMIKQGETALGDANLHLLSSDPTGEFFDLQKGSGLSTSCGIAILGTPNTFGGVSSLSFKQIGVLGCQPNPGSPILLWEAKWTTNDFTPREVLLESSGTSIFDVFSDLGKIFPDISLFPDKFEHGSGVIQVIPAPSGAMLLAASIGLAVRRRR